MNVPPRALVKVVLTSYNRPEWLQLAIESVLAQTYRPIHIVIVDDASPTDCASLIHGYANAHPGLITPVVKRQNAGVADSIRLGIETGPDAPYVAFLNDDDIWYPQKLERQVETLNANTDLSGVFSDADVIDAEGELTGDRFTDALGRFVSADFVQLLSANPVCASSLVVTRHIASLAAASMPEHSGAWDFQVVLLTAGYGRLGRLDDVLVQYRDTAQSLHANGPALARDTTIVRDRLFRIHPALASQLGGPRAARRQVALATLNEALWRLRAGSLSEFLWHSLYLLRQRQLRVTVWLVIHTLRELRRRR